MTPPPDRMRRLDSTIPDEWRVAVAHHRITLNDGHAVGISVAGAGVPFVMLHGIGLDTRTYVRILSRLPRLGFLAIGIDAAGHGNTAALPRSAATFRDRAALLGRTLDQLGVRRAVFAGHSMGGRNVIELAAEKPERVIAAILLNAAAGSTFDQVTRRSAQRSISTLRGLALAAWDTQRDTQGLSRRDKQVYRRALRRVIARHLRLRSGLWATVDAVHHADETGQLLDRVRAAGVPTIVVHGERDLVVPLCSGIEMAERANGSLHVLPGAFHSWLLANPQRAIELFDKLLQAELGAAIEKGVHTAGLPDRPTVERVHDEFLHPKALVRSLIPEIIPLAGPNRDSAGTARKTTRTEHR